MPSYRPPSSPGNAPLNGPLNGPPSVPATRLRYCGGVDAGRRLGCSPTVVVSHLAGRSRTANGRTLRYFSHPPLLFAPGPSAGSSAGSSPSSPHSGRACRRASGAAPPAGVSLGSARQDPSGPGPRYGHSLTRVGTSLFLFGGIGRGDKGSVRGPLVVLASLSCAPHASKEGEGRGRGAAEEKPARSHASHPLTLYRFIGNRPAPRSFWLPPPPYLS